MVNRLREFALRGSEDVESRNLGPAFLFTTPEHAKVNLNDTISSTSKRPRAEQQVPHRVCLRPRKGRAVQFGEMEVRFWRSLRLCSGKGLPRTLGRTPRIIARRIHCEIQAETGVQPSCAAEGLREKRLRPHQGLDLKSFSKVC